MSSIRFVSLFVPACARIQVKALCVITSFVLFLFAPFASAQSSPEYGSMSACNGMTVGSPTYGPYGGELNNFVPFPSTHAWNTNIAGAAPYPDLCLAHEHYWRVR